MCLYDQEVEEDPFGLMFRCADDQSTHLIYTEQQTSHITHHTSHITQNIQIYKCNTLSYLANTPTHRFVHTHKEAISLTSIYV